LKANLSALGDGIIVLGLGVFILSLAYVYYQSIQPNISSSVAFAVGFLVLGASILVAGALKIAHAVYPPSDQKQSGLKTPLAATFAALLIVYYLIPLIFFRIRF
jgi:hypothetical protein